MKKFSPLLLALALITALSTFALPADAAPTIRRAEILAQGGMSFLRAPQWVDVRVLAANTAESHTIPVSPTVPVRPTFVIFESTCPFYANFYGTAAVPVADVTDGSGSEFSPTQRYIGNDITTISLIAESTCAVTMLFYQT